MAEPKQYQQKDLGYSRTPTSAKLVVTMPDRSRWAIPVQLIADSRDDHYADDGEDTIGFIKAGSLRDYEIYRWAGNNMNWEDVAEYAEKLPHVEEEVDFQEGWLNGHTEIEGDI